MQRVRVKSTIINQWNWQAFNKSDLVSLKIHCPTFFNCLLCQTKCYSHYIIHFPVDLFDQAVSCDDEICKFDIYYRKGGLVLSWHKNIDLIDVCLP